MTDHRFFAPLSRRLLMFLSAMCLLIAVAGCLHSPWEWRQAQTHMKLGVAFLEAKQYHAALKELLVAEELYPQDPKLHYYLGIAYHGKGLPEKAIEQFCATLALDPNYAEASNFLGAVYLEMGRRDEAIASFEQALRNVKYDTPDLALYNIGRAWHAKGDERRALEKYAEALRRQPASPIAPLIEMAAGEASLAAGEPAAAVAHLRAAISLAPDEAEAYFWLGAAYRQLGKNSEAAAAYAEAIRLAPASELATQARGALSELP